MRGKPESEKRLDNKVGQKHMDDEEK